MTTVIFPDQSHNFDQDEIENIQKPSSIDIRIQQRNGKKCLTLIEGLPKDLDLKKILREMKKRFSTNGSLLKKENSLMVIQLQGDKRQEVFDLLDKLNLPSKIHGF